MKEQENTPKVSKPDKNAGKKLEVQNVDATMSIKSSKSRRSGKEVKETKKKVDVDKGKDKHASPPAVRVSPAAAAGRQSSAVQSAKTHKTLKSEPK